MIERDLLRSRCRKAEEAGRWNLGWRLFNHVMCLTRSKEMYKNI
jgi:hypothetical protein